MFAVDQPLVQIDNILRSEALHSSQALRLLFKFLVDKALAGEADQLKEYTIGLDVFHKPPEYDPRKDATVRIHVSRLRQKLAEYYRTEGKNDSVVFSLPKGHFKLVWETKTVSTEPLSPPLLAEIPATTRLKGILLTVTIALVCAVLAIGILIFQLNQAKTRNVTAVANWTPDLEALWRSFAATGHPMLVVFNDPVFVAFPGPNGIGAYFRERSLRTWADTARLPEIQALQHSLGNPRIEPSYFYVSRGEVQGAFLLAKLFGARQQQMSLVRLSQLSWEELSANNVVLMGPPDRLNEKLVGLPLQPELVSEVTGVRNLHPQQGEQPFYADDLSQTHDGEAFALISQLPGPLGNTGLATFVSNRSWGDSGAIEFLTDPSFAHLAVDKLRSAAGPSKYYQILVKVKFRDGVTTDVSYVLHRNLDEKNSHEESKNQGKNGSINRQAISR